MIVKMFNILYDNSNNRNYIKFINEKETKQRIVLLLNNLGGTTQIEMGIILKYILKYLNKNDKTKEYIIERIYNGSYMTSLDMRGFSITLLKVDDQILNALDFPVSPIAWIPGQQVILYIYISIINAFFLFFFFKNINRLI